MKQNDPYSQDPIIIVRRKPIEEEPHHGGAWKIAYADFVTSLMAFFLVMWLVNITDDKTKAAIVTYFNPINLVNDSDGVKGLTESDYSHHAFAKKDARKLLPVKKGEFELNKLEKESQLLRSPYKVLDTVMSTPKAHDKIVKGQIVRDSFGFINAMNDVGVNGSDSNPFAAKDLENNKFAKKGPKDLTKHDIDHNAAYVEVKQAAPIKVEQAATVPKKVESSAALRDRAAQQMSQQLDKAMQKLVEGKQAPKIELIKKDDGVLINLLDNKNFGMFDVGSAKPRKETVLVLEQVAKILQAQKGRVVISGHTDARPYRSLNYDNWQLSTARAQMVYYMLVRGGFDKERVAKIVGYADKELKNTSDPNAAENRYIGIFLKLGGIKSAAPIASVNTK